MKFFLPNINNAPPWPISPNIIPNKNENVIAQKLPGLTSL